MLRQQANKEHLLAREEICATKSHKGEMVRKMYNKMLER